MNRLIINNRTTLSDLESLQLIIKVVKLGRISNNEKQYCYGTSIGKYMIVTEHVEGRDSFFIYEEKKKIVI